MVSMGCSKYTKKWKFKTKNQLILLFLGYPNRFFYFFGLVNQTVKIYGFLVRLQYVHIFYIGRLTGETKFIFIILNWTKLMLNYYF